MNAAPNRAAAKEQPMRTSRLARSFMTAGTLALLSILSLATTVMANTTGGGFPR